MNSYCVYKHTSPNGKVYIGLTGADPIVRWRRDGKGYRTQRYFWSAIQKYGWDSFSHEVVCTGLSKEAASQLEIELIARYDATNPDRGYNLTRGGEGGHLGQKLAPEHLEKLRRSHIGRALSAETRRRISEARRGMTFSEDHRRHLSESHVGKPSCRKGTKVSPETLERIRAAKLGERNPRCRRVRRVETGEEFFSAASAAESLGLNPGPISKACRGLLKTYGGFHWEYV